MGNPESYFFEIPGAGRPSPFSIREEVYADIRWFNENRATSRVFHPVNGIEGVVIHATAGASTAGAISWWRDPKGNAASAHWIVPDEDELGHGKSVLAVVYESLAAWHVRNDKSHPKIGNKDRINHWSLGIEIVNRQVPSDAFSNWQVEMTALLVRYCWAKYPNLKYVFSHALVDPERRSDPGAQFDWNRFTELIVSANNDPKPSAVNQVLAASISKSAAIALGPDNSCCM